MAGMVGEEQIRRVKQAIDIVQLIGDYVPLQRAGVNFKACCPFHGERTPSFQVYTEDQHYHCYGCGAHGDAITFLRAKEGLEFVEAVEMLARRAGIELEFQGGEEAKRQRGRRERLLRVHEWATEVYERCLWTGGEAAEARTYLVDRGLGEAVCKRFRLGWAPGRGHLLQAARSQRIDDRLLAELDLALDRNGRLTDRFFERLMFPICDRFGHPIAFSGRLLPVAERAAKEAGRGVGKYINSTDTPLYHKGQVVFNLHRARGFCREAGRILVMEGPTDVMAADQAGIGECVAVLGTALTAEHARQLGSAVSQRGDVVLLFDGDAAGRANSLKAVKTCLSVGLPTRVVVLPEERDPAELLAAGDGREEFERALASQRADVDHLLATLAPRPHTLDQRELLRVVDQLLDCFRAITDTDLRDGYIDQAAGYLGWASERLYRRLQQGVEQPFEGVVDDDPDADHAPPALDQRQETVLHCLVRYPDLRDLAFDEFGIEPAAFPPPWRRIVDILVERPGVDADGLRLDERVHGDPDLEAAIFRYLRDGRTLHHVDVSEGERALREAAEELLRSSRELAVRRLEHELRQAQESGEHDRAAALFQELMAARR